MEDIKKLLKEHLEFLREESKQLPADYLGNISLAMCEIAKTIKELK